MLDAIIAGTGIRVSRFGFGTGSLHRAFDARDRRNLLEAAADVGFTHFDTAPYYGYGLTEIELGAFMRGRRSRFTVTTKVGLYPWGPYASHASAVWFRKAAGRLIPAISQPVRNLDVDRARKSLDDSLKRLETDYVDFLFLHEPEPTRLDSERIHAWLSAERQSGRIRAWGVAGVASGIAPLLNARSPLAQVVQTADSLDQREADFVFPTGRQLEFTYGYFGTPSKSGRSQTVEPRAVLTRNTTGCILVSSRRVERLRRLAAAA